MVRCSALTTGSSVRSLCEYDKPRSSVVRPRLSSTPWSRSAISSAVRPLRGSPTVAGGLAGGAWRPRIEESSSPFSHSSSAGLENRHASPTRRAGMRCDSASAFTVSGVARKNAAAGLVGPHVDEAIERHADIAKRGVGNVHPIALDPPQDREMRVAAGLDEYDHRAREFCELVVVQAEALCLVTPRLRESLQIAQREAFALQLGELVGLQRLEQRSQH